MGEKVVMTERLPVMSIQRTTLDTQCDPSVMSCPEEPSSLVCEPPWPEVAEQQEVVTLARADSRLPSRSYWDSYTDDQIPVLERAIGGALLPVALVGGLFGAGCGGSSPSEKTPPPSQPNESPQTNECLVIVGGEELACEGDIDGDGINNRNDPCPLEQGTLINGCEESEPFDPPEIPNSSPIISPVMPQVVDEGTSFSFIVSVSDPDGDPITLEAISPIPGGALFNSSSGLFQWTPDFLQAGAYGVEFWASDGKNAAQMIVPITVTQVNHWPPELDPIVDRTVDEGSTVEFTVSATDEEGATLAYSASGLPTGATFNSATGLFRWTPNYRQARSYPLTFTASDGTLSDSVSATVTVDNVLVDLDGDGYREDLECNDDDAAVHPLEEYEVNTITTNTTVCPGLYRGVNIVVGADDISIGGVGVSLDHFLSASSDIGIEIAERSGVVVTGFTLENYPTGIRLSNSDGNRLDGLTITGSATGGLLVVNSHGNVISGGSTDSLISLGDSNSNVIEGVTFDSASLLLGRSQSNTISGNVFSGTSWWRLLLIDSCHDNVIRDNTIRGGSGEGTLSFGALTIYATVPSNRNTVENNLFEDNNCAINVLSGTDHVIRGNTVMNNTGEAVQLTGSGGGAMRTLLEDNFITDNWKGVGVYTNGNTIRNNDFRRNTYGNTLRCDRNTCEGNLE